LTGVTGIVIGNSCFFSVLFSPKFILIGLYIFSNTALFFGLLFIFLKTFPLMCDLTRENKVMDDIETSSMSSEKRKELSIMEEG
jgi:hypothetical protein